MAQTTKAAENIFYGMTIVSSFTCLKRPDWNFAFGLMCYYMMKTSGEKTNTLRVVLGLNALLLVFDVAWMMTMGQVWHGRPAHDQAIWAGFKLLHNFILFMSGVNILLRLVALVFLCISMSKSNSHSRMYDS